MKPAHAFNEFFPGVLDPEGRPWEVLSDYDAGIEGMLKTALLTQHRLVIPHGYLFDNPALIRLIYANGVGDCDHARAFRALLRDLLRVATTKQFDESAITSVAAWNSLFDHWAGTDGWRHTPVVPNAVDPSIPLSTLTAEPRALRAAIERHVGIEFDRYFGVLALIGPMVLCTQGAEYDFDRVLRESLGRYHGMDESVAGRLQQLFDSNLGNRRISRSLLKNSTVTNQVAGVAFTDEEYRLHLLSICRQVHQSCQARLYGATDVCSDTWPSGPDRRSPVAAAIGELFRTVADDDKLLLQAAPLLTAPSLCYVHYEDVLAARVTNASEFATRLVALDRARNWAEYAAALEDHWSKCAGSIVSSRLGFDASRTRKILESVPGQIVDVGYSLATPSTGTGPVGAALAAFKALLVAGVMFWPRARTALRAHSQMSAFLRSFQLSYECGQLLAGPTPLTGTAISEHAATTTMASVVRPSRP